MQDNKYAVPVAIVLAGALIAGALFFVKGGSDASETGGIKMPSAEDVPQEVVKIRGVQQDDYIIGPKDAKLVIVEYSDFECPFCKRFHETMHEVAKAFPNDVAWVYRQFPLQTLHQKAPAESVASECVGKLGGNEAFWKFANKLYEVTPSNDGLDLAKMPEYAVEAGVDKDAFVACLDDEDVLAAVQTDFDEAVASGGQGTPYSLILYKGEQLEIPGAIPFDDYNAGGKKQPGMKSIIEGILKQ